VTVRGSGCDPFGPVTVRVNGVATGSSTSDREGRFEAAIRFQSLPPGRHRVVAECGDLTLEGIVQGIVTTQSGGLGARAGAAVMVLSFFVILGSLVAGGRGQTRRRSVR
jgi:hypothetical protein